ncbi:MULTISPECIES: DUF4878 domain-containing protein [unclassified Gilliamella]|uniref:DUF4878 domain-containing protein n=1 Tax=unclassified Gilliamella TaxID=2685620 RepID=UPI001C6A8573|nr:DUF4878 domain-containing protein [Gilliamella sp. ESL0441]QYN44304.1 DUF4878 domain-containing protein [Gilliamella sp. ESL0441]
MKIASKIIGLFLFAFVLIACSTAESTPEKLAETYVKAMFDGDADKVYKLLYIQKNDDNSETKTFIKGKLSQMIAKTAEQAKKHGGFDKTEILNVNYRNEAKDAAIVITSIIFKDGTKKEERIKVIKIDDKWLLNF